jgi:two-component system OmpR family sensor kinase
VSRGPRLGTAARLLLLHGFVLALVLGVVLLQVVRDFSAHYQNTVLADLGDELSGYAASFGTRPPGQGLEAFSRDYLLTHPLPPGEVMLVAVSHQPVLGSGAAAAMTRSPVIRESLLHPPRSTRTLNLSVGSTPYLALASPIVEGGKVHGVVIAVGSLSRLQSETGQVALLAAAEAAVALVVALLSAYLILRRVLRTVGALTQTAVEASSGDLTRRVGYRGADDEVGRMAAAFDELLGRISATVAAQRALLSDVSHQLRTPLTVAKGHLEVLRRGGALDPSEVAETTTVVVEELDQMSAMVDQLLLLGHSLEPDFIQRELVDLRSFMADLATAARVLAPRHWVLDPVPDAVLVVDPAKLRGALLNLLDNAVKATVEGDTITLGASCGPGVRLSVTDTGSGIDSELQEAVFDRFRRGGDRGQRGAGLGLAIVKAVVEGHGGHVELSSAPGRGTAVALVLPPACLWTGVSNEEEVE